MARSLIFFCLLSFFLVSLKAQECFCPLIYAPICALKDKEFSTFSNPCFASCAGFKPVYAGNCLKENVEKSENCIQNCQSLLQNVCGVKGTDKTTFPNECIGKCLGFEITKQGFCDNQRALFFNKDFFKNFGERVKEIGQKVADTTKKAFEKVKDAAEDMVEKGKEIFNKVKAKASNVYRRVKGTFQNCTCNIVERISDDVAQRWNDFRNKVAEKMERIKNAFISFGNKALSWIEYKADQAVNATFLVYAAAKTAVDATRGWVKRLTGCFCSREFTPVCVEADNGQRANIINKCYANCAELEILSESRCENMKENFVVVLDEKDDDDDDD